MSLRRHTSSALMATVVAVLGCEGSAPEDLIKREGSTDALVFVKASDEETLNRTRASSNLYILTPITPDGEIRPLTSFPNATVYDPCVNYEGDKILFSMAPERGAPRNIWEINVDGTGLRRISGVDDRGEDGDDFDPLYLPDGRIAFTSNRPGYLDEYNRSRAEVLHTMNADGSNIQQISFNLSDDFDPFMLANGRIAYTRWDHHGTQNRFPMFATNPDGSGTFHLFGPHNRNFFHTTLVPDGRLVSIVSNKVNGDAGSIVLCRLEGTRMDPPRAGQLDEITTDITISGPPFDRGAFKYPRWISENRFVVSYSLPFGQQDGDGNMNEDDADYGLYTFEVIPDGTGGETISNLTFLYNDPQMQELDSQLIAPRDRPIALESSLDLNQTTGVFHVSSIFKRQTGDGQEIPDPAEVSKVMVIEGIPTRPGDPRDISTTSFERKRIIGTAPIETDGSFHIEVPANTPISFNILDNLGRSIVTKRNWIYARNSERFMKCAGCHTERDTPPVTNTLASARQPTDLDVAVASRETINFIDNLAPIVASKCVSCHVPEIVTVFIDSVAVVDTLPPPGGLDFSDRIVRGERDRDTFPLAYFSLAGEPVDTTTNDVTVPGFSRRSRLIDVLLGVGSAAGAGVHPIGADQLTSAENRLFMTWVDLGAQYR